MRLTKPLLHALMNIIKGSSNEYNKKKHAQKTLFFWLLILLLVVVICTLAVLAQLEHHDHPLLTEQTQLHQNAISNLKKTLTVSSLDEHNTSNQKQSLIHLAQIELVIQRNPEHCISLLKEASLLTHDQNQIAEINRIIDSLSNHPYFKRLSLIQTIQKIKPELPIPLPHQRPKPSFSKPPSSQDKPTPSLLTELRQKLEQAIIIRHTRKTVNPILDEYDQVIYTHNIEFLLGLSQRGLLEMDNALFHYGIDTAHDLLLHQGQLSVQAKEALETLESLQTIDLSLPDIDFSLLNDLNKEEL